MKNLFSEDRLVFMSGPETRGSSESLKTAAEMPDTTELSYDFAKKLIKITKTDDEVSANPNRLIKFINSRTRTKARTVAKWLKMYAKDEGYKLSKSDILKKTKNIVNFYNPRKNRKLRAHMKTFMKNAVEDNMTSKEELSKMKKMVGAFASKATGAMKTVINSRSVQSIDAGRGRTSSNRSVVVKKYVSSFRAALKGTNIIIVASASKIEAKIYDVEKTAKAIKSPAKRNRIIKKILSYRKA